MEEKKHPKYDLDHKRPLFFIIGLIVAMLCMISAFEWKSQYQPIDISYSDVPEEPVIFQTPTIQKQPEPPKPKAPKKISKTLASEVVEEEDELVEKYPTELFTPDDLIEEINPPALPDEPTPEYNGLVESPATYPGGWDAFNKFIGENIDFPRQAISRGVDGKVFVQFTINIDGTIKDIQVVKGIGLGCDEEAIRVLKTIPARFVPAKNRGREVPVKMILPIHFRTK